MAKYTVTCTNGKDVFEELVEADTVDSQGVVVLFLRKVAGVGPTENWTKTRTRLLLGSLATAFYHSLPKLPTNRQRPTLPPNRH